jgi:hypothetical protein
VAPIQIPSEQLTLFKPLTLPEVMNPGLTPRRIQEVDSIEMDRDRPTGKARIFSMFSLPHGFDRDIGFLEFLPYFLQDRDGTGRVPMDA